MEADLARVDQLNLADDFEPIQPILDKLLAEDPDNPDILYRCGEASDPQEKVMWLRKANELGTKTLQKFPKHPLLNKWMAIVLGKLGDYTSTKEKIQDAWRIREYADTALAADGKDPVVLHTLGKWCEGVSKVGWLERKLASVIFATPPESTFEEAIDFYMRCEAVDPNFKDNRKAMADTYVLMGKRQEAKEWYQKALEIPATSQQDKRYDEEMRQALAKL